jgi:hypothetical protein
MSSSIPPASTKFLRSKNLEHWKLEIGTIENTNAVHFSAFHFHPEFRLRFPFAQQKFRALA